MKDSFCISSIAKCDQIHNSNLNKSVSKHLWSFSKDQRFKLQKPQQYNLISCDKFYKSKPTRMTRSSAMGFDQKTDFTKDKLNSPPCNRYQFPSCFQTNKIHNKGYTLHLGRQQTNPLGIINLQAVKVPGSGAYTPRRLKQGNVWSMRPKLVDQISDPPIHNKNPGPGHYQNPQAITSNGNQYWTKYKSSGCTTFNPKKSDRFFAFSFCFQLEDANPGPGNHSPRNDLPADGSGKRNFSVQKRRCSYIQSKHPRQASNNCQQAPGPGSYKIPSDFGHYHQFKKR